MIERERQIARRGCETEISWGSMAGETAPNFPAFDRCCFGASTDPICRLDDRHLAI